MHYYSFLCWIKFCSGYFRQIFFILGTKKVVTGCVRQLVVLYSNDCMGIGLGGFSTGCLKWVVVLWGGCLSKSDYILLKVCEKHFWWLYFLSWTTHVVFQWVWYVYKNYYQSLLHQYCKYAFDKKCCLSAFHYKSLATFKSFSTSSWTK